MRLSLIFLVLVASGCTKTVFQGGLVAPKIRLPKINEPIPEGYLAYNFDYPVGKPDAHGYYNAQGFGVNTHLGDDWNARTGGNSDLGDTIYAIANGKVNFTEDIGGGWGNVIRISHFLPDSNSVESLYAHCDEIFVDSREWVKIGEPIGTIGTAHGQYPAHLHLELREFPGMPVGGGYSTDTYGYLNPEKFIKEHRTIQRD